MMRIIASAEFRPCSSFYYRVNPLNLVLSLLRNVSTRLSSLVAPSLSSDWQQNGRAFLVDIAALKGADSLTQIHYAVLNPLLENRLIPEDIALLIRPLTTLTSALALETVIRPVAISPLLHTFRRHNQAAVIYTVLMQPLRLMAAPYECKVLLYQLADFAFNRLSDITVGNRLSGAAADLPALYLALQVYREIPLSDEVYSAAQWLMSWWNIDVFGAGQDACFNPVFMLLACLLVLWRIKPSVPQTCVTLNALWSITSRLMAIGPLVLLSRPAPIIDTRRIPALTYKVPKYNDREGVTAGNDATSKLTFPLLPATVGAANIGWQLGRYYTTPRSTALATAISIAAALVTYAGYQLGIYLTRRRQSPPHEVATILLLKNGRATRSRKAVNPAPFRTLHLSNFTPHDEIDVPVLSAVRTLLNRSALSSSCGMTLIAALAARIFDDRLDFVYPQINALFTSIMQAGSLEEIGFSGHHRGNSSEAGLIIWSAKTSIDLAQDIAARKITRPELRDALALLMHLTLRASGNGFPIINSLTEMKYHAVGLYYQWYINNRPSPIIRVKPPNLTLGEFSHRLEDKLRAAIAPYNAQNADVARLIQFLVFLEMPNVAIGILFDNGTAPSISKQNSYAIHADLALKNRGDELSFANYYAVIDQVKNEDIRIINLITHSEVFAAAFKKQGFIADIHRMVFAVEYDIAALENRIGNLGYIDRMAMITVAISSLGAQRRVPWTAKSTLPYPGNLSVEQAFKTIHNDFKYRESRSGRTGAVIPRSHLVAIERQRNWLEQYIALNGNLTVMLEVDPDVFANLSLPAPYRHIAQLLKSIIPLPTLNILFSRKYDDDLVQESLLIEQSLTLSLALLSQENRQYFNEADRYIMVNLVKFAHTRLSFFAQPEGHRKELYVTWKLASLVIAVKSSRLQVYAFNRRYYLKMLKGSLISRLAECSSHADINTTLAYLLRYMSARPHLFIENNRHQRCPIPSWAISSYSYELETMDFSTQQQVMAQLRQYNLQPRRDAKSKAFAETAEERDLLQDPRWLALRPWLPFIECYDLTSGLANGREKSWITAIDGLTCGLNFIPAGKIVTAPVRIIIKGARKLTRPSRGALKTAMMQSVDRFFSSEIPGVSPQVRVEFKRLYKTLYSHELHKISEEGIAELVVDGIYTFISRGSPIPLPNFFKWDMPALFHAVSNMNKGLLLKTLAQGIKGNAAPAVGFLGQKIGPKVFRSVRQKYQISLNELLATHHGEIIEEISNPQAYLPYDVNFNEEICSFNRLRSRCDLVALEQITPVRLGDYDSDEQLEIRRTLYRTLLLSLFRSDNPVYWHRALHHVQVNLQVAENWVPVRVSLISVSPPMETYFHYLKQFYVPLWDSDFDTLLQLMQHAQIEVPPPEMLEAIIAGVQAGNNASQTPAIMQQFHGGAQAHLVYFMQQLVQDIRWTIYHPDVEDDLVSSRYLAEVLSRLSLFSMADWDKNFVIDGLIHDLLAGQYFLASITASLLQPFMQQLLGDLKTALNISHPECVYRPHRQNNAGPFSPVYQADQRALLQAAYSRHQPSLAERLPALFIIAVFAEYGVAREGRPHDVSADVWSMMTDDRVYLFARMQIQRLVYRHYDRFLASYDYRKARKAAINGKVPDRPRLPE